MKLLVLVNEVQNQRKYLIEKKVKDRSKRNVK